MNADDKQSLSGSRAHHRDPRPLIERNLLRDSKSGKAAKSVTVNQAESPLSWLHARGHLTDRQFLAGENLRQSYESACLGPRVTMRWDGLGAGRSKSRVAAPTPESEKILFAKDRFDAAIEALGSDLSDIAWRVICAGEGVSSAERNLGWPTRSGKLVLRIALNRLADYYRIAG
ncbi:DUF6456 domain-containing protein [Sphingorhabdus arenilitoris]|uniref:DUF6456 domain-containing protein n=1 Tax=Sphingorhabdus arenilitoris TaxID=1490041 RepID=A0ABV8RGL2_9SPHN